MNKIKLFVIFFSFIITNLCFAQHGWFWQNPQPTSNPIVKTKYLNSNFAIGVGDFGSVIKTTNGGNVWVSLNNFTSNNLKNLHIIDSLIIYVVGTEGSAFKTINSGQNWSKLNLGSTQFNDIIFLNASTGFIVGQGRILKTTNGGNNWVITTTSIEFNSVFFVNSDTGFIAGSSNTIYKTTNNGINWIVINPETGVYSWYSVYFKDENNGLIFGNGGKIFKSTNGGINWVQTPTNSTELIMTSGIKDSSLIYAGGGNGLLLRTTNFGLNWLALQSGQGTNFVSSINAFNDTSITTVGWKSCYPCHYEINYSTNNGTNWNSGIQGVRASLTSIDFININTGIAVGSGGNILRTSNGGINWTIVSSGGTQIYNDVRIFSSGVGYICGSNSKFLKTTDLGLTWVNIGVPTADYNSLSFINDNTGFLVGKYSIFPFYEVQVLKTTNGGNTFIDFKNNIASNEFFNNVQFIDQNNIYVVGNKVFKSSNGGNNWVQVHSGIALNCLYFENPNTGIAAGQYNVIKTTNGGVNWLQIAVPSNYRDVSFLNSNTGIAVGYNYVNSGISRTTNGGASWIFSNGVTANTFNAVNYISENVVYIAGDGGTILKSTNGGSPIGLNQTSSVFPFNFHLSQNYPNPFNPQTKIKFDVPKASFTKLVICDLLGREVATLVNEELKPGTYEADWDGSKFSSGVYFYKIITEGFVETKKMVLMK